MEAFRPSTGGLPHFSGTVHIMQRPLSNYVLIHSFAKMEVECNQRSCDNLSFYSFHMYFNNVIIINENLYCAYSHFYGECS